MDTRRQFSKLKKKLKDKLTGRKREPDGIGTGSEGERPDSTSSLPRPELHVAVGGVRADRPLLPDEPGSVSTDESEKDRKGRGADVNRGEVSRSRSHLPPDVEVGVRCESGPGREGNDADRERVERGYLSPSVTPTLHSEEPDST